jgi:tRNA (guanine-N7-)-methyltransferase
MGRRSLPKLDPQLDLAGYFFELEQAPSPLTSESFFGREAPLEIEMGSGKGLFLSNACGAAPERCFVGIEIAHKYARHAAARLARRGLTNGKLIHGDGIRLFAERVPDASVAAVHVYFPDPWWKKRHHKRRVMRPEFLRHVERVLLPGGALHFWTDVEEYYLESLAAIAESTRLIGPLPVEPKLPEHDLDYRTHFERRMRLHGEAVYRSEFRK